MSWRFVTNILGMSCDFYFSTGGWHEIHCPMQNLKGFWLRYILSTKYILYRLYEELHPLHEISSPKGAILTISGGKKKSRKIVKFWVRCDGGRPALTLNTCTKLKLLRSAWEREPRQLGKFTRPDVTSIRKEKSKSDTTLSASRSEIEGPRRPRRRATSRCKKLSCVLVKAITSTVAIEKSYFYCVLFFK